MHRAAVYACIFLLVVSGVAPAVVVGSATAEAPVAGSASAAGFNTGPLGCVDGVCHDDELSFNGSDELSSMELQRLVDRSMARVEHVRGERFESDVPVDVMSRETFRARRSGGGGASTEFNRWNDQVWRALFVVGDEQPAEAAIDEAVGQSVTGFYRPTTDQIVLITPDPDAPRVNERTLIHELTHALQDQRHDLAQSKYRGATQDADLAVTGVYEGEAVYMERQYRMRCGDERWQCLAEPASGVGGGSDTRNRGVLLTLLQPYSSGPAYIAEVIDEEGWAGVDDRMETPPRTTSELIHREPREARRIDRPDTASAGWERYPDQGVDGAEVAGEASIFVMFWYQAAEYGAETIDPGVLTETDHPYERRNYAAEPSTGWVADELVPYRRGDDDGYVWATEWETAADASEFRTAYEAILTAHNATTVEAGVYIVEAGGFDGAYAISTDGTRVTIVHAPTTDGLSELAGDLEPNAATEETVPGFGPLVALVALAAVAFVSHRRGR